MSTQPENELSTQPQQQNRDHAENALRKAITYLRAMPKADRIELINQFIEGRLSSDGKPPA